MARLTKTLPTLPTQFGVGGSKLTEQGTEGLHAILQDIIDVAEELQEWVNAIAEIPSSSPSSSPSAS